MNAADGIGGKDPIRVPMSLSDLIILIIVGLIVSSTIGVLAWYGSGWISHLSTKGMYLGRGNDGISASVLPEFHTAKAWAAEGQVEKAIRIAEAEEAKRPGHYEGNLLLAQWHCELQRHRKGLACLDRILINPLTTPDQRSVATDWKRQIEAFLREKESVKQKGA